MATQGVNETMLVSTYGVSLHWFCTEVAGFLPGFGNAKSTTTSIHKAVKAAAEAGSASAAAAAEAGSAAATAKADADTDVSMSMDQSGGQDTDKSMEAEVEAAAASDIMTAPLMDSQEGWDDLSNVVQCDAFWESQADEAARVAPLIARVAATKKALLIAEKDLAVARFVAFRWERPLPT